jgi:hypothetical protein
MQGLNGDGGNSKADGKQTECYITITWHLMNFDAKYPT